MYKSNLYENLILVISKSVKHSINEMARKSVNRTIDKKLWLTVSSIISRNRSTEAENIKPIGSDKDNLLLRYVAALLIMKKPCPNSEKDIETIKTFKLVGLKYLELGGTIDDIKKLYNENTGDSNNIKTDNPIKSNSNNDITTDNNADFDDSWIALFNNDESDDDIFADVYTNDITDNTFSEVVLNLTAKIDNKLPLLTIFLEVTKKTLLPAGFRLIKPTNTELPQKLCKEGDNSVFRRSKYAAYFSDISHTWKVMYKNPVYNNTGTDFQRCALFYRYGSAQTSLDYDTYYPTVMINAHDTVLTVKKKMKDNKLNPSLFKDTVINQYLNEYHKELNNISDPIIKKLMESNALIDTIYISPDEGLMIYSEVSSIKNTTGSYWAGTVIYGYNSYDKPKLQVEYYYTVTITFTGKVNYYQKIGTDDKKAISNSKDLRRKYRVFNKIFVDCAYNLKAIIYPGFSDLMFKYENSIPYCESDMSNYPYMRNQNLVEMFYTSKEKRKHLDKPVPGTSKKHFAYYQYIDSGDPKIFIMEDSEGFCRCILNYHTNKLRWELTNKGLKIFNNEI